MPDIPRCDQCGLPHVAWNGRPACKAHKSAQPDQPCRQQPIAGLSVCRAHGGASARAKTAASREIAKRQATAILDQQRTLGNAPTDTDPVEALRYAIGWARTHCDWARAEVQRLAPHAVIWGDRRVTESDLHGLTIEQRAELHGWVHLYNYWLDRLVSYSARAIHAGLAEREVRLEEERGALIAEIIRAILADLELDPAQQARALSVVPLHLRRASAAAG